MREHTGGVSTFGIGFLTDKSSKYNMNFRGSNVLEVIREQ